jgi:AcrR family transcriptional regulator
MGRKEIDRQRLRERILDQAERMVRRHGLARSRMGDLIRASGVSRRTFYTVFGSKEEVVKAVIDRRVQWVQETILGALDSGLTTEQKLELLLGMVRKVASTIPPDLLRELATAHPEVWEYINDRRMEVLGIWKQLLVEGQRRGEIRRDVDPEFFMLLITTVVNNMVTPAFLLEHDMAISDAVYQLKEILFYGLLSSEEARS